MISVVDKVSYKNSEDRRIEDIFKYLNKNIINMNTNKSLYEYYDTEKIKTKIHFDIDKEVNIKEDIDLNLLYTDYELLITDILKIFFPEEDFDFVYSYDDKLYIKKENDKPKRKISIHIICITHTLSNQDLLLIVNNIKNNYENNNVFDTNIYRVGINKFRLPLTNKEQELEHKRINNGFLNISKRTLKEFKKHLITYTKNTIHLELSNEVRGKLSIVKEQKENIEKKETYYIIDNYSKDFLLNIINGFEKDYFMDYEKWLRLTILLVNNGFSKEEIFNIINDTYTTDIYKNVNGYNEIEKVYDNISDKEYDNKVSIGTLIYWLKENNIDYYNDNIKYSNTYMKFKLKKLHNEYCNKYKLKKIERNNFDIMFFKYLLGMDIDNYKLSKLYFEKYYIYLLNDNSFYQLKYINDINTKSKNLTLEICPVRTDKGLEKYTYYKLKNKYDTREYKKDELDKKKFDKIKEYDGNYYCYEEKCFLKDWYKDKYKKEYVNLSFEPNIEENNRNDYNIFNGFGFENITEEINDNDKELFNKFLDIIKKYYCNNDDKIYNYFLNHLSHIIQYPNFKNHIAYIFYSPEKGTGKSQFLDFISDMIGDLYSFSGNMRELFSKHSTASVFKLINGIEELSKDLTTDNYERLKDYIQRKKAIVDEKYKNIIKMKDYVRYFILLNNEKALPLEKDNRRFVLLRFKKIDNYEVMKDIINDIFIIRRNKMIKLFGEYLKKFNIQYQYNSPIDWFMNRQSHKDISLFYKHDYFEELLLSLYKKDYDFKYEYKKCILSFRFDDLYEIYKLESEIKIFKGTLKKKFDKYDICIVNKTDNIYKIKINLKDLFNYLKENKVVEGCFKNQYE